MEIGPSPRASLVVQYIIFLMIILRVLFFLVALGSVRILSAESLEQLRLNQIQVIGSHNSYKAAIDRDLYDMLVMVDSEVAKLDYCHPPLSDQLRLGLRNLELDVFHDPKGGRFAKPLGIKMATLAGGKTRPYDPAGKMQEPGFKVLHVQEIDFRSNCLTLRDALAEIREWSDKHPWHLPVVITLNLKSSPVEVPGAVVPLDFDDDALNSLDQEFVEGLGREKIIFPDDVRGDYETLEKAVLAGQWPLLKDARGKILLVMDESGKKQRTYLEGHPSLRGRVMFVTSEPGRPEAAVMIRNDPVGGGKRIAELVRKGYLVRTRADAGTEEARRGDYARFEAAKQSGAQVVTTDYYLADWRLNPDYRIRFDDGTCIRPNPLTCPQDLIDKEPRLEAVPTRVRQ